MKSLKNKIIAAAVICVSVTATVYAADLSEKTIGVSTGVGITIDGSEFVPTDENGNEVEPMLYDGTVYLPVRALSTALGNDIAWDSESSTVNVSTNNEDIEELKAEMQEMKDKEEIQRLVDEFSNLADEKDADAQALLFTEDAQVLIINNGRESLIEGREEIAQRFGVVVNNRDALYHMNGQADIDINGDTATGTVYCRVVLINTVDGITTITDEGVRYNDEYVKQSGKWLIASRESNFIFVDSRELS